MFQAVRVLTRPELTAALAARQMLLERRRLSPVQAIRALTPLQAQDTLAPYVALAARLEGFTREQLHAAIERRTVVKSTLMRTTLHLTTAGDYPAFAQLARQVRLRGWRQRYQHLDEAAVDAELRSWLKTPRTNNEIRERIRSYPGVPAGDWELVMFARTLLALVQLPPAGFWGERRAARFAVFPRPLPDPVQAATRVVRRYLAAFGPASRRDIAAWGGVPQRDFADALARIRTVSYLDERGVELLDLPGQPLPGARADLPVRFLARWDQALLAHDDRERIMTAEVRARNLTLSGDQTMTVDGRVAASWHLQRSRTVVRVRIEPHLELRRSVLGEIRAEAKRTAVFCHPAAERVEVDIA